MPKYVYRIQRKSDGYWYGQNSFHPVNGRFLSLPALTQVLIGQIAETLEEWQVIRYVVTEDSARPAEVYTLCECGHSMSNHAFRRKCEAVGCKCERYKQRKLKEQSDE